MAALWHMCNWEFAADLRLRAPVLPLCLLSNTTKNPYSVAVLREAEFPPGLVFSCSWQRLRVWWCGGKTTKHYNCMQLRIILRKDKERYSRWEGQYLPTPLVTKSTLTDGRIPFAHRRSQQWGSSSAWSSARSALGWYGPSGVGPAAVGVSYYLL